MKDKNQSQKREEFGRLIRDARKEKDIGLRELARKLKIDYSRLSRIERGERPPPDLELIVKLADFLDINKKKLLSLAGVPEDVLDIGEGKDEKNWISGRVCGKEGELTLVDTGKWKIRIVQEPEQKEVTLGLRPEDITLSVSEGSLSETSARNLVKGKIKDITPKGNYNWVKLNCESFELTVSITDTSLSKMDLETGKEVLASFKATAPVLKKIPNS